MVQIIMAIIKVAWLATSYTLIFSYLSQQLPALIGWCVGTFQYMEYVIPFITAAVGTCRWLIGNIGFNFAMWSWIALPAIKMVIYFGHQAATFAGTAPHSIQTNDSDENFDGAAFLKSIEEKNNF